MRTASSVFVLALTASCLLENASVILVGRRLNREEQVRAMGEGRSRLMNVPVLSLALPICVREYSSGSELRDIRELRLTADTKRVYEDMKTLLNAQVDVEGTILLSQTRSGGPDVLLNVRSIKRRVAQDQARR